MPVVIDRLSSADPASRRGVLTTLQVTSFEDDQPFDEDDFVFAHTLLDHVRTGWRYRLPVELLHRAHREFYVGVYDQGHLAWNRR